MLQRNLRKGDEQLHAKTVSSWEVIEQAHPFGNPLHNLRLRVTYATGKVKVLAPSFMGRISLDAYVARFHKDFVGKETKPMPSRIGRKPK